VAPRAHPNDGLVDLVEFAAAMGPGERWKAWRRLPAGAHVPHPAIKARRASAFQLDAGGRHVWIDGVDLGPAGTLSVRVEPDALTCAV
jgi:diacylglycerol kinase family enzyme